jgi:hypothetical protein
MTPTSSEALVMLRYLSGAPMTFEQCVAANDAFRKFPNWDDINLVSIARSPSAPSTD